MKFSVSPINALLGLALVFAPASAASSHKRAHQHQHLERSPDAFRPVHSRHESSPEIAKRGQCAFPTDDSNLVAVTPDAKNAGWAMSPDQECKPGSYCPFACKPGMVMAQWDPDSTYSYPASMNGGLYCDKDGTIKKPFPNKDNCVDGVGSIQAVNKCGKPLSFCQTVLPGNEAMLIPTLVSSSATLAVPDTSYWCSTAAHFYINPPGTGEDGCVWGTDSKPVGNWSPYVAGANVDGNGQTFVKLGWNPIFESSSLKSTLPSFGVKIECPDGGCNGLPCAIDPSKGEGGVQSNESASGAGGANFCVVTVPKGKSANIVVFSTSGGGDSSGGDDKPSTTSKAASTTAKATSTTEAPSSTSSSSSSSSTQAESSTSSTSAQSSATTPKVSLAGVGSKTTVSTAYTTPSASTISVKPGIFHENDDSSSTPAGSSPSEPTASSASSGDAPVTSSSDEKGLARRKSGSPALVGLVVAFVAAAYFL